MKQKIWRVMFAGQVLSGCALGVYLMFEHMSPTPAVIGSVFIVFTLLGVFFA